MEAAVHLQDGFLQPGYIPHDYIVLAHMGGKQPVLLVYAQCAVKADAIVSGARRPIFNDDALLDGHQTPQDAHSVGWRGKIANQTHAGLLSAAWCICCSSSAAVCRLDKA